MVLKRYGDQYIAKHGTRITAQPRKVLRAVMACREDSLGTIQYACSVYHPHVHVMVPSGSIDGIGVWQSSRASVFVPEQILEQLIRGKLKHKLRSESFFDSIPNDVWKGRFVVDSKAVGSGESPMAYLAPYVTRGAVAKRSVTQCDEAASLEEANLTLQVKRSRTRQYEPMPIRVEEFIRRWLQHVLPFGFHRERHYGFVNARDSSTHVASDPSKRFAGWSLSRCSASTNWLAASRS
ncbi:transposase [Rhodopirellula europaea SH398]|jgi:hypothetical protein|uniref:Transposase n=1 Tax=Rhodopirellula europaea SH398 TaxID=1263868 RepID=M5RW84_9BACT|nr:transposase [Rhodopirellula europaea]EMI23560.1 transposase [Rhodopirellula europaea SH398]